MTAEHLPDGSPDCPLVRLSAFTAGEARTLHAACLSLSTGESSRFDLTAQPWCRPTGPFRLAFVAADADVGLRPAGVPAEWALTPDTWSDVADRVRPFTAGPVDGYAWLDESGSCSLLLSPSGQW